MWTSVRRRPIFPREGVKSMYMDVSRLSYASPGQVPALDKGRDDLVDLSGAGCRSLRRSPM